MKKNLLVSLVIVSAPRESLYTAIKTYIDSGRPVIAWSNNIPNTDETHFVIVYGYDNEKFYIRDPYVDVTGLVTLNYNDENTYFGTIRAFYEL